MWHIMSHKVKLDRRSIKKRILQLDCAGKLPPHAGRLPAAVAARGVHQRERGRVRATVSSRPASWSCSRRARVPHCLWGWATMILATSLELWEN